MAVSSDNTATHTMPAGSKQNLLRLMAAILDSGADCSRILSRDCADLGVDPRAHLSITLCCKCRNKLRWDGSARDIMQILTAGGCYAICGYKVIASFQIVRLYDLAAARGHIDPLCSLPALYSDLNPPPSPPPPPLQQQSTVGRETRPPPSSAASTSAAPPVTVTNGRFTIVSCSEDDLPDAKPASGSGKTQAVDDPESAELSPAEPSPQREFPKEGSDGRKNAADTAAAEKDDATGVSHRDEGHASGSASEGLRGGLSLNRSSEADEKSMWDQAQDVPSEAMAAACAVSDGQGSDVLSTASPANTWFSSTENVAETNSPPEAATQEEVLPEERGEEDADVFVDSLEGLFASEDSRANGVQSNAANKTLETNSTADAAARVVPQGAERQPDERKPLPPSLLLRVDNPNRDDTSAPDAAQSAFHQHGEHPEDSTGAEARPASPSQDDEQDDADVFEDSLEGLFLSEDSKSSSEQASSDTAAVVPEAFAGCSVCRHPKADSCHERREIVRSAVRLYVQNGFSVDKLVRVLRSQPCAEDVISVFDSVAALPEAKGDCLDWKPLVREFGLIQGPHTGHTPLMAACVHGNEKLLQSLLAEGKVGDINAKDSSSLNALGHLLSCSARGVAGDSEARQSMSALLKEHAAQNGLSIEYVVPPNSAAAHVPLHRARSQSIIEVLPEDVDSTVRKRQARLCQLAWQSVDIVGDELEELSSLFDQEINVMCCKESCRVQLFPDVAIRGDDPAVVFSPDFEDNQELFACIEKGACMCRRQSKFRTRFLPACAAVAAGNFRLFRSMMSKFAERVGSLQRGGSQRRLDVDKPRSALKRNSSERGAFGGRSSRTLWFDTSLARFHGDRLLALALCQALYTTAASEALNALDDLMHNHGVALSQDSTMSLLDMALRTGDEETFKQLLNRFSVSIQSEIDGLTPLLVAVSWGNVSLARWLLSQEGARPEAVTSLEKDILDIAFGLEPPSLSDEMVLMLLKDGNGLGYDPLSPRVPSALQTALVKKRLAVVDYLLEQGQVTVPVATHDQRGSYSKSQQYEIGWVPVVAWVCSFALSYSTIQHLLDKGLDCLSPLRPSTQETPLLLCVGSLKPDARKAVSALIERGADVNERNAEGMTPLVKAMRIRNCKVLGCLIMAGAIVDSHEPPAAEGKEVGVGGCQGGGACGGGGGAAGGAGGTKAGSGGDGGGTRRNGVGNTPAADATTSITTTTTNNNNNATQASGVTTNGASNIGENTTTNIATATATTTTTTAATAAAAVAAAAPAAPRYRRGPPARNANNNNNNDMKSCLSSFVWHALKVKEYRVVEMALQAGYRVTREEWFANQADPAVQHGFPPQAPAPAGVWDTLNQPLRLTVLCRRMVRGKLGSALPSFLASSGLPQSVVDYLLMKDLVEAYLDEPSAPSPQYDAR